MIAAILCINPENIAVGFVGDSEPQSLIEYGDLNDRLQLQTAFRSAVDALLTSPRALRVVIIEPPLFPVKLKQHMAQILLKEFHVSAIGFLPRSVSCLAGHRLSEGLVLDKSEKLAVPCYDFRELTTMICGCEEGDAVDSVRAKLTIDTRRPVTQNVVPLETAATWTGASALLKHRQVWPLLTREKFKSTGKVWDSLYDMR